MATYKKSLANPNGISVSVPQKIQSISTFFQKLLQSV